MARFVQEASRGAPCQVAERDRSPPRGASVSFAQPCRARHTHGRAPAGFPIHARAWVVTAAL